MASEEGRSFPRWLGCLLILIFSPFILLYLVGYVLYGLFLHLAVWLLWLPRGRSILVVTSDSPVWSDYMAEAIIPFLKTQAIVLNWSKRQEWLGRIRLSSLVFSRFGGREAFNPLVVVFKLFRRAKVFRLWEPFKDFKHGQPDTVEAMKEAMFAYIGVDSSG